MGKSCLLAIIAAQLTYAATANLSRLPLHFEPNFGQTAGEARFVASTGNSKLILWDNGVTLLSHPSSGALRSLKEVGDPDRPRRETVSRREVLRMRFLDANPQPEVTGREQLPGRSNYFLGEKTITDVPHYARVVYSDVYPGIDVVYHGHGHQLEYDLVVAPGADPERIRLAFSGAQDVRVTSEGDLLLAQEHGEVLMRKPRIYQEEEDGAQKVIPGDYLWEEGVLRFRVGEYDAAQPLVIDPILGATYFGAAGDDRAFGVTTDAEGNVFVTGMTASAADFPLNNPAQAQFGGETDVFVAKLNRSLTAVDYSTYFGGSGSDQGVRVQVDEEGRVIVVGATTSADLPSTGSGFQPAFGGGDSDMFVVRLNAAGDAVEFASYLGGMGEEFPFALELNETGGPHVTGWTTSENYPTTQGAAQTTLAGGADTFVTSISPAGNVLTASGLLGGISNDIGRGLKQDVNGDLWVAGFTLSGDFPVTGDAIQSQLMGPGDAFLVRMPADLSGMHYGTLLGGIGQEETWELLMSPAGQAAIGGTTNSPDFPAAPGFPVNFHGQADPFVAVLDLEAETPKLEWTYLGGGPFLDQLFGMTGTTAPGGHFLTFSLTGSTDSVEAATVDFLSPCSGPNSVRIEHVSYGGALQQHGCLGVGFINGAASDPWGNDLLAMSVDSETLPAPEQAFDPTFNGEIDAAIVNLSSGRETLLPYNGALIFEQVSYEFDDVSKQNSSTGIVTVDIERLTNATGLDLGYLNVVTSRGWVAPNLLVDKFDLTATFSYNIEIANPDEVDNDNPEPGPVISSLPARMLFTPEPQLNAPQFNDPVTVAVAPTTVNIGGEGERVTGIPETRTQRLNFMDDEDNFAYTLPRTDINVQAAQNQCVPMGYANSLAWLEAQYPAVDVPHEHKEGLRGDDSLVGQLGTAMGRDVTSRTEGSGVKPSKGLEGKFSYLSANGLAGVLTHQHAGSPDDADFEEDFESSGVQSAYQGAHVTFEWLCSEIQKGEDIEMVYRWEDEAGNVQGGHLVRVAGCGKTRGVPWLKILHDKIQTGRDGRDIVGLRVQKIHLGDLDDDGDLNFDSIRKEIRYAVAESPLQEAKAAPGSPPFTLQEAIVNGASFAGRIAAGGIITAFGLFNLVDDSGAQQAPGERARADGQGLPSDIGGLQVLINGRPAPLYSAFSTQASFQIPFDIGAGEASMVFVQNGRRGATLTIPVEETSPGIFSLDPSIAGPGRGVIQNQDFSLNIPDNPAAPGEVIIVYMAGLGAVDNPVAAGEPTPAEPLARTLTEVTATVGGAAAGVAFAGLTPGFAGLYQVNLTVPALSAGDHEVVIQAGGVSSNGALVAVGP